MLLVEWKLPHCAAIRFISVPNPMAFKAEPNEEGKAFLWPRRYAISPSLPM
jgi:hypothetical protein